jgi:hypothetical protein
MTYALERGNLILPCFAAVILAYGPLLRSARLRWFFAGLAVNFKVYLVGALFAQLLRHRWRWFEGAALAAILVYLVTFAIYGEGSPKQIYDNLSSYLSGPKGLTPLDLWFTSSFIPFRALLGGESLVPLTSYVGSDTVEWGLIVIDVIYYTVMLSVVAAVVGTWWRPEGVPLYRMVGLSIAVPILSQEASGYTQALVLFFVLMEPWRGFGRRVAIVLTYILGIGLEYPLGQVPPLVRESYLAGGPVIAQYTVGLGSFIRPVLFHIIVLTIALVTIRDLLADARANGRRLPFIGNPREGLDGAPAVAKSGS